MRHRNAFTPIVVAAALAGFALPPLSAQGAAPRSEAELRAFYQRSCSGCHGEDGSATAADGRKLKGRDFTSEKDMHGTTDQSLATTIRKGLFFGMAMPAYKHELTEEEALILVRNILRKARKGEPILAPASAMAKSR
ncbi:MAG: c-type cytochrome [Geothrix sp.]|uniref:c-type cytochrome n=1 Tax=Geothrix sp. TaxID=1962974 RepID=UPI0017C86716|nr:c-type cytochrome [Geothrix sp.]NWJ40988.1 c-type cytochrome [Geothrix sp.]WIL21015.1 MAG: cytochrome c [Geothrix sp.]